jgi:hypothetical protein
MVIEMGKQYRTRDGREVRIYATDGCWDYPIHDAIKLDDGWYYETWTPKGYYDMNAEENDRDLIEVKPRIKRTYWVNLYPDDHFSFWKSRKQADEMVSKNRIACVKFEIDCEEGEGL